MSSASSSGGGGGSGYYGGGSSTASDRAFPPMDAAEQRWVYQENEEEDNGIMINEECDYEDDRNEILDSEEIDGDEDNLQRRLIRTGPRLDSFDVEALEVPGAHRSDFEDFSFLRKFVIGCQTLGVVFGDVGTSPLYVFDVMFSKAPANEKEDIIGALSLVLYTLILIPLVKYVLVVLWANDDGEGGTFALYSLICRHAKVSLLPNQLPSDARISSFRLKVPSPELERSLKIKERLEKSLALKKLLLILVLVGTSMVIVDGVVTPVVSVTSAVSGLSFGVEAINQEQVVMISVAFLVILFSTQKFGTSKLGLALGPALFLWFCSLAGVGIYNLIKHDHSVLKAFNPAYIFYFFKRNSTKAWYALGGCLLCATGSEAMFADLCYFSVRSIQLTFMLLVFPCLVLGYLGQAAYLANNLNKDNFSHTFFSSIPSGAYWPVVIIANVAAFIASRTMTTATFSCIKQSTALGCFPRMKIIHTSRKFMGQIYIPIINWFLLAICVLFVCTISSITEMGNAYGIAEIFVMMTTTILLILVMLLIWQINIAVVTIFAVVFLGVELVFCSSVLRGIPDGSWIVILLGILMFFIMYVWNYGSKLKYETEVRQKMSMDLIRELGPNLGTVRAPGIGLLYNELVKGVPAIFGHFLTTLPAVHSMIIFVCIKYVPVPVVPQSERFLFRRVCPKSYHIFRCIARYGYKDVRKENHLLFEQLLIESLEKFIRREYQEKSLESDGDSDSDEATQLQPSWNGSAFPMIAEATTSEHEQEQSFEWELSFVRKAKECGVVYLLGHGDIRSKKEACFLNKLLINYFYAFLRKNCRRGIANLTVPHSHLMQVGITYMV